MSLDKFSKTIVAVYGKKGRQWLRSLPNQLEQLAKEHGLILLPPFAELSFNYVIPVLGPNQEEWVLKCSVPNDALIYEINALKHYAGLGCVSLIKSDIDSGWMIIERCVPGSRLVDLFPDAQCIAIAVSVMQRLWHLPETPEQFPSLEDWLQGLYQLNQPSFLKDTISKELRHFVLGRAQELLSSQKEQVVLHADLHHYNILHHHNNWLAIDPKGVVGEREFEIGAFLRNPLCIVEDPIEAKEIKRNLDQLIELTSFDRQRVLSWSIVQAVLCVCWCVEDNMPMKAKEFAAFAHRLYSL